MRYRLEIYYWKLFNGAMRVVGLMFLIVGLMFGVSGIRHAVNVGVGDFEFFILMALGFVVGTVIGLLAMTVEAFYPDHIRKKMKESRVKAS